MVVKAGATIDDDTGEMNVKDETGIIRKDFLSRYGTINTYYVLRNGTYQ